MSPQKTSFPQFPDYPTALITGASRGIGLALVQELIRKRYNVIATARNAEGCRDLWEHEHGYPGRVRILNLDVTREDDLRDARLALSGEKVDLLVNNAGVFPEREETLGDLTEGGILKAFTVNALGPIRVTQAFLDNLELAPEPVVATLSSKMGSIEDNTTGGSYAYRISKAAVNMFNKTLSLDRKKLTCVVLHPGWVQTEMGGKSAPTSVDDSVLGLANVILGLTRADSGRFLDFQGKELPW